MKIVVDAYGGDYAPLEIIKGVGEALKKQDGFDIALAGDEAEIQKILIENKIKTDRITILHAPDIITNDDVPTLAIRNKTNSSMVAALDYVKSGQAQAFVSAGPTGAVLTGSLLKLGRIKGISRPGLCPILPAAKTGRVALIDCGANVDCKPHYLCDFAIMGSLYMKSLYDIESPKVALLNNGTEDTKGNEKTREAFKLLKEVPNINFVGNMEARDFMSGDYDVVVADGFDGNVLVKSVEGTALVILKSLKNEIKKASLFGKLGAVLLKKAFNNLKDTFDYTRYGGSLFLGVDGVVIKSHGSSKGNTISNCILQAYTLIKKDIVKLISDNVNTSENPKSEENN